MELTETKDTTIINKINEHNEEVRQHLRDIESGKYLTEAMLDTNIALLLACKGVFADRREEWLREHCSQCGSLEEISKVVEDADTEYISDGEHDNYSDVEQLFKVRDWMKDIHIRAQLVRLCVPDPFTFLYYNCIFCKDNADVLNILENMKSREEIIAELEDKEV